MTDRLRGGVHNVGDESLAQPSGLDDLVSELTASGATAIALLGDIGSTADVEQMFADVDRAFGRVDVLVNNAAAPQGADRADIGEVTFEAWQEQLRVTLNGAFLMSQAAIERMRPARYGRIVNVSSMAGIDAAGRSTAYSAAKAGVLGLTRSLAIDVAGWGITVNAVCPGLVATSRSMLGRRGADRDETMRQMAARIPVGRVGRPEDVAHAVEFLSHERSGYITAQSLPIDGGGIDRLGIGRPPQD